MVSYSLILARLSFVVDHAVYFFSLARDYTVGLVARDAMGVGNYVAGASLAHPHNYQS